jgi:DNA-binding transcriptional LysR family regulator
MLGRLRALIAIDDHRNFQRAAQALNISQPSLTRALQVLEGEFGARLFERSKSQCEPTIYGQIMLRHARSVVAEVAEARREIGILQNLEGGEFRIGAGPIVTQLWLGRAVGELSASHRQLKVVAVDLPWHDLPDAVMSGTVDVAIGEASDLQDYPDIVVGRLPRRRAVFVCRQDHPLTAADRVAMEDLAKYPLASPLLPYRVGVHLPADSAMGVLAKDRRQFVPSIACSTWSAVWDIVESGEALGIVPVAMVKLLGGRRLRRLSFEPPWMCTEYALMWRRDRMAHPALKPFREIARKHEGAGMATVAAEACAAS